MSHHVQLRVVQVLISEAILLEFCCNCCLVPSGCPGDDRVEKLDQGLCSMCGQEFAWRDKRTQSTSAGYETAWPGAVQSKVPMISAHLAHDRQTTL